MALEGAQLISNSSDLTNTRGPEYDVFLSFRGEDTRTGFTGYLYDALNSKGIRAFLDDESLRRGDEISPALFKAIELSKISIVVFSQNYAFSKWCLDELVKIMDCMKLRGQCVLPVFYQVDPSDVRHQRNSYGQAMTQLENRFSDKMDRVSRWKSALSQAANLSGWHIKNMYDYEYEFVKLIVEDVSKRLNRQILHVAFHAVGLEPRVSQVISLLALEFYNDVRMVGIYGMSGIGKSTIVRAVFNQIAPQFDGASFLPEIRETSHQKGLVHLQEQLLFDILGGEGLVLGDIYKGIPIIRERLSSKKILLILDDVNRLEQLQALVGLPGWFGPGSRILITTTNKHLLTAHKVNEMCKVNSLNKVEALELFSWHAFGKREPEPNYAKISKHVVCYAEHFPLALEVIGRTLIGRSLEEWEDALHRYESLPEGDIVNKLRISYDDLDDIDQKIFLHIACFFQGKELKYVGRILEACDLGRTIGINKLIERGLLTVECGFLRMHRMVQEMGKEIIRRESPSNVVRRSRLWNHNDVIQVLTQNTGTDAVEGIILDLDWLPQPKEIEWTGEAFENMRNLKILIIRNACFSTAPTCLPNSLRLLHWDHYPASYFPPPGFHPEKLVALEVPCSNFPLTEKPFMNLEALTKMDFSWCDFITEVPDLSGVPNLLCLYFSGCVNLIKVHDSVGSLSKLEVLSFGSCSELTTLPQSLKLKNLEALYLYECSKLRGLPDMLEPMENLREINFSGSGIEALPSSIEYLLVEKELEVYECKSLEFLPRTIAKMESVDCLSFEACPRIGKALSHWKESGEEDCSTSSLKSYDFNICYNISKLCLVNCNLLEEHLALIPRFFPSLKNLSLEENPFEAVPACFREFRDLEFLDLNRCWKLQEFPNIVPCIPTLKRIFTNFCMALSPQSVDFLLEIVKRFWMPLSDPWVDDCSPYTDIWVPVRRVPEWFVHRSQGETISFYAHGNYFPRFILCAAIDEYENEDDEDDDDDDDEDDEYYLPKVEYRMSINKGKSSVVDSEGLDCKGIMMCLVRGVNYTSHWHCSGWNHVEVGYKFDSSFNAERCPPPVLKEWGIYWDEEETRKADFHWSIKCPSDWQEPEGFVVDCDSSLEEFGQSETKFSSEGEDSDPFVLVKIR